VCCTRGVSYRKEPTTNGQNYEKKKSEELKWVGMTFLTPLKVIDRFEKQNPTMSVNGLSYERISNPSKLVNITVKIM